MRKTFLFIILVLIFFISTLPKEQLWYKVEETLKKEGIYFNQEKVKSNPFLLNITDMKILYRGINIADLQNAKIYLYLFYNRLDIENLVFDMDKDISIIEAFATYHILNPFKVSVYAKTNLWDIKGCLDLKNRKLALIFSNIKDLKKLRMIFKNIKKSKKGYLFEKEF